MTASRKQQQPAVMLFFITGLKWDAIDYKKLLITIQHTVVRVRTRVAEDQVNQEGNEMELLSESIRNLIG